MVLRREWRASGSLWASWPNNFGPLGSTLSSVQFSRSVVSDSLRPHVSQHARPPCPSVTGWGIDLDYCDIEWFALEINRDHSVVFEIASRYFILDSFVDYNGYSVSSKGFYKSLSFAQTLYNFPRQVWWVLPLFLICTSVVALVSIFSYFII